MRRVRLSQLKTGQFDLVLVNRKLDVDYSDGIEVIRMLKTDPDAASVPVMLGDELSGASRGGNRGRRGSRFRQARIREAGNAGENRPTFLKSREHCSMRLIAASFVCVLRSAAGSDQVPPRPMTAGSGSKDSRRSNSITAPTARTHTRFSRHLAGT